MAVPIIAGFGEERKRGRTPSKEWTGGSSGGGLIGSGGVMLGEETSTNEDDNGEDSTINLNTGFDSSPLIDSEYGITDEGLATGWRAPAWWDDPNTGENEWQDFIFNQVGGIDATGLTQEEFFSNESWAYGDNFLPWEESGQKTQYENVLEKLELLNEKFTREENRYDIDLDALGLQNQANVERYTSGQDSLSAQSEAGFVQGGGGASGRSLKAVQDASKNLNQALSLESRNIDLKRSALDNAYKGTLDDLRMDEMDYTSDLVGIEDQYENKLVSLISGMNFDVTNKVEDEESAVCGANASLDDSGTCINSNGNTVPGACCGVDPNDPDTQEQQQTQEEIDCIACKKDNCEDSPYGMESICMMLNCPDC